MIIIFHFLLEIMLIIVLILLKAMLLAIHKDSK